MKSYERVRFVVALLAAGWPLLAPTPAYAQTFGASVGGVVTQAALQASRNAQAARRFDLTLDDAVQRALERNLDIAVQRINPLVQDMEVATANAAFLPFASSGFGLNKRTNPNRTLFDGGGLGGANIINEQGNYDLGVNQRMKWGGGQYDVIWNSSRFETTSIFTTFNPSFGANMTLNYTQPLLRGFRTDPQRTQLVVQRINRDISDIDLESDHRQHARQCPAWRTGSSSTRWPPSTCSGRRWSWPSSSCATTGRASRSARWRRSTSCRRSRKPPCDASSSRRPSRRCVRTSCC